MPTPTPGSGQGLPYEALKLVNLTVIKKEKHLNCSNL